MPRGVRGSHGSPGFRSVDYISRPMPVSPLTCHAPQAPPIRLILAALVVGACSGTGSEPRTIPLMATGDTILAPYGDITDAAWLAERRWVVIAPQDRAVSVADFERKSLSRLGGPKTTEVVQPFHLFRSGDSVFVADWLRHRLTDWSLDGRFGGARQAQDGFRGALPRERDAAGRWYFELRPPPGPQGRGNLDSAVVLRTDPDFARADTVLRLAPFDMVEVIGDGGRRLERRLLSGQDRWGVLPDGAIWVARIADNRVEWRDTAGVRSGKQLPDRVLPVTDGDRDIFLSRFDPGLRGTVSQTPFAAIKPPFDDALTSEDGHVWLVKNRAIGDTLRSYQIVDRTGHLVAEATHPGLGRILALGGGYAVVGEPFAGGVRLLLFQIPADSGGA